MKDKKIMFGTIIAFIFLLSMGLTYAYFSVTSSVEGDSTDMEVSAGTLSILYNGGPEVNAERIEPGWTSIKTFTVTNTGTLTALYSIDWKNITNTIERDELRMSMTCVQKLNGVVTGTCEGMEVTPVATSSGIIKGNIEILQNYTHEYTIEFEFVETGSEQNYNQGKAFGGVININNYIDDWYSNCTSSSTDIKCKMLTDAQNRNKVYSDTDLLSDNIFISEGLFYTLDLSKTENNERVYYYRGETLNNYVYFGGYCWTIVRTVEDGSVRLKFGGSPLTAEEIEASPELLSSEEIEAGVVACKTSGTFIDNAIEDVSYGNNNNDNSYVGYMTGIDGTTLTASASIDGAGGTVGAHVNTYQSAIKTAVDEWYEEHILSQGSSLTSLIADTPYCNDRSIFAQTPQNEVFDYFQDTITNEGYGQSLTLYGAAGRLMGVYYDDDENSNILFIKRYIDSTSTDIVFGAEPTFKCPRGNIDRFTVSESIGNGKLTYPVGLLTADEMVFADGLTYSHNYTFSNQMGWTMTPFGFVPYVRAYPLASVFTSVAIETNASVYDDLKVGATRDTNHAFPAISLVPSANVIRGTGAYNNPYVIAQ